MDVLLKFNFGICIRQGYKLVTTKFYPCEDKEVNVKAGTIIAGYNFGAILSEAKANVCGTKLKDNILYVQIQTENRFELAKIIHNILPDRGSCRGYTALGDYLNDDFLVFINLINKEDFGDLPSYPHETSHFKSMINKVNSKFPGYKTGEELGEEFLQIISPYGGVVTIVEYNSSSLANRHGDCCLAYEEKDLDFEGSFTWKDLMDLMSNDYYHSEGIFCIESN